MWGGVVGCGGGGNMEDESPGCGGLGWVGLGGVKEGKEGRVLGFPGVVAVTLVGIVSRLRNPAPSDSPSHPPSPAHARSYSHTHMFAPARADTRTQDLRVSITGGVHFDLVKRVMRDISRSGQGPEEIVQQVRGGRQGLERRGWRGGVGRGLRAASDYEGVTRRRSSGTRCPSCSGTHPTACPV